MRSIRFTTYVAPLALALGWAACISTGPNQPGSWGSDQAVVTRINGVTTLEILAGGCYGSYGELDRPVPSGTFLVSGQYTQLTGAFPGKVVYPATYSGISTDLQLTITIAVPALQTSFGPFVLTRGVEHSWGPCRYP
ncbi:MAG: hypothetical protein ACREL2_01850 [Gemmatimonadales bacterium]